MKLVTYLQRKHWISRRDFSHMIRDVIKVELEGENNFFTETVEFNFHPPKLVLFNKPKWFVCSKEDPHNKTIYDILPDSWRKDR